MKNICFFFALCLLVFSVSAQTDDKAKKVLQNVSTKIKSLKSFKANFSFHLSSANGKVNETKKGTFAMKGEKYRVQLAGQEIICDNKTVWTYNKDASEVQVSTYNPKEQTISPAKLFTDFYDKEYSYKYIGEKKLNNKKCDVVEMSPLNKSKQLSKIEICVDKATNLVTGGTIIEKNGNKYQYEISGVTPNAVVPDSDFAWDTKAHPGVEVVDLR